MNKYTYTNHKIEAIIFITLAENIFVADKNFERNLGYNVAKHNYIGCKITFNVNRSNI